MKRILTLFTGSKLATAVAASALSAVTAGTLVAGGIIVSRVIGSGDSRTVTALPAAGAPLDPIVVKRDDPLEGVTVDALVITAAAGSSQSSAAAPGPLRTASLVDAADRVTGSVRTALDGGEPTRMDEVTAIERIESILRHPNGDEEPAGEDGKTESAEQTEPAPDEPEERSAARTVEDLAGEAQVTGESATDPVYSGTDAGSASPSA